MGKLYSCLLTVCAIAIGFVGHPLTAQTTIDEQLAVESYDEFNPHFFIQLQAGGGYTVGEVSKFKDLTSPSAAINAGYRFSPLFGLRIGASGWEGRGTWVAPRRNYKFNYIQANIDAMLSLSNLFCGSNASRILDFYVFLGAGTAVGFHNTEAVNMADRGFKFEKLWKGKRFFPAGRAGLGLDINLSRRFAINVEVYANLLPDNFNSKRGSAADWQFNGLVGITYNFGGRSKKIIVERAETVVVEAVPEPTPEPVVIPERSPEPEKAVALEPIPITEDIFFRINSSTISQAEKEKVETLIRFMKENAGTTVIITGFADKATGYPAYNMKISRARANSVASMLKDAGISDSRITIDAKGDTEQPFKINAKNRVAIAVTK